MAKSRIKGGGVNSGRPKRKFMGKGCSTLNKKVKARMQNRVHLRYPGIGLGSRYEEYKRDSAEETREQNLADEAQAAVDAKAADAKAAEQSSDENQAG
ncbi:MAG: hypothetical protein CSA62_04260 [Planctomycetota bacterium]|nr:MAG: hypothetical protein CSA62_04260 [Planctomycetota bacterium]